MQIPTEWKGTLSDLFYGLASSRRLASNDPYLVHSGTHVVSMNVMLNALDATLQLLVLRWQDDVS